MAPYSTHAVTLQRHPQTPAAAVRGISARVGRTPGGVLAVSFLIEGDMDRLRVPPGLAPSAKPPHTADRLWEHTCCEIFIARTGLPAYHEFNFSPSGEWAVYAFERYREGAPSAGESVLKGGAGELDPHVTARCTARRLEVDALIRLDRLSPAHADAPLSLALSAVVEEREGSLSYWALRHPPGKPDFHHATAYALDLPQADPSSARSPA